LGAVFFISELLVKLKCLPMPSIGGWIAAMRELAGR
jgi:hypothetical protein